MKKDQHTAPLDNEAEQILARWAWYTPEAQKVWTVVPPEGTRLRCRYEPPCDFHGEGGAPSEVCRWKHRPVTRGPCPCGHPASHHRSPMFDGPGATGCESCSCHLSYFEVPRSPPIPPPTLPGHCGLCGGMIANNGVTCTRGCPADDGRGYPAQIDRELAARKATGG